MLQPVRTSLVNCRACLHTHFVISGKDNNYDVHLENFVDGIQ